MLLTQSQVSVFLSAVIIFLFTAALFLSGYVLQQKTLTNLRAAIRPQQPTSQLYTSQSHDAPSPLPLILTDNTNTIIEITTTLHTPPEENRPEELQSASKPPASKDHQGILASYFAADATRQLEHERRSSIVSYPPPGTWRGSGVLNKANKLIHRWMARARGGEAVVVAEAEDESVPLENLSRAARRKRIKMEIMRSGGGEEVDMSKVYRPRKRVW